MSDDLTVKVCLVIIAICAVLATFWFVAWTVGGPTYHRIKVGDVQCIGSVAGPAGLSCDWPAP